MFGNKKVTLQLTISEDEGWVWKILKGKKALATHRVSRQHYRYSGIRGLGFPDLFMEYFEEYAWLNAEILMIEELLTPEEIVDESIEADAIIDEAITVMAEESLSETEVETVIMEPAAIAEALGAVRRERLSEEFHPETDTFRDPVETPDPTPEPTPTYEAPPSPPSGGWGGGSSSSSDSYDSSDSGDCGSDD